jgi:hypothetical protein
MKNRLKEIQKNPIKAGPENTINTLKMAIDTALSRQIQYLVVASTGGDTALQAHNLIQNTGLKLVVVTHNTGFSKPGEQQFNANVRPQVEAAGGKVYTGTMVLRNVGSAIRTQFHFAETELINATLRMLGQGIKVVVEIAAMACDAGLIPSEEVIAVAGTGRGADTAVIIKAESSNRFFDIKIREIIVKPDEF